MSDKIKRLREQFSEFGIDAYIIPSNDEFQNEYLPLHLKRLEWLTGFSGSSGVLVITHKKLLFGTDGRYLLQASKQLSADYEIADMYSTSFQDTWKKTLTEVKNLGYDPMLHSISGLERYKNFSKAASCQITAVKKNLVDLIWREKPIFRSKPVIELGMEYTGISASEKVDMIVNKMDKEANYLLVTSLDSICWMLNLRGSDIPYNPFFLSYLLISKTKQIILFTDAEIVPKIEGVNLIKQPLHEIYEFYSDLLQKGYSIQIDKSNTSVYFCDETKQKQIILQDNPIFLAKACKNEVELQGIEKAHILDAVAICKFLYWLENNIDNQITERQAAEKLLEFRKNSDLFQYPSFQTISAFGENGAIIHYNPEDGDNKILSRNNLYLFDSGGQYLCGTTDVTRTVCFGTPSDEQKIAFTYVLKGMIRLSMCVFPHGTSGDQLDSLARYDLWKEGLDYAHGTGHGVGHFLSVHEGPQGISKGRRAVLNAGMILSNEPGYYKNGWYGIRIENLMSVQKSAFDGFLQFKTLTLVPIAKNLIKEEILTKKEKEWLDCYHKQIIRNISQFLSKDEVQHLAKNIFCK